MAVYSNPKEFFGNIDAANYRRAFDIYARDPRNLQQPKQIKADDRNLPDPLPQIQIKKPAPAPAPERPEDYIDTDPGDFAQPTPEDYPKAGVVVPPRGLLTRKPHPPGHGRPRPTKALPPQLDDGKPLPPPIYSPGSRARPTGPSADSQVKIQVGVDEIARGLQQATTGVFAKAQARKRPQGPGYSAHVARATKAREWYSSPKAAEYFRSLAPDKVDAELAKAKADPLAFFDSLPKQHAAALGAGTRNIIGSSGDDTLMGSAGSIYDQVAPIYKDYKKPGGGDPRSLAAAVEWVESKNNPDAVSRKNAVGVMQIMPGTLKKPGFGVTPAKNKSTAENRRVGMQYLEAMISRYDSIELGLAAYNWGPGSVDNWLASEGLAGDWPKETSDYVERVLARHEENKQTSGPIGSDPGEQFPRIVDAEVHPPPPEINTNYLARVAEQRRIADNQVAAPLQKPLVPFPPYSGRRNVGVPGQYSQALPPDPYAQSEQSAIDLGETGVRPVVPPSIGWDPNKPHTDVTAAFNKEKPVLALKPDGPVTNIPGNQDEILRHQKWAADKKAAYDIALAQQLSRREYQPSFDEDYLPGMANSPPAGYPPPPTDYQGWDKWGGVPPEIPLPPEGRDQYSNVPPGTLPVHPDYQMGINQEGGVPVGTPPPPPVDPSAPVPPLQPDTEDAALGEGERDDDPQRWESRSIIRKAEEAVKAATDAASPPAVAGVRTDAGSPNVQNAVADGSLSKNPPLPTPDNAELQAATFARTSLMRAAGFYASAGMPKEYFATAHKIAAVTAIANHAAWNKAINLLEKNNDPRLLAKMWSTRYGKQYQVQSRSDGKWNVLANGQVVNEGVSTARLVSAQRSASSSEWVKAINAAAATRAGKRDEARYKAKQAVLEARWKSYGEMLKAFFEREGKLVTHEGTVYRLLGNGTMMAYTKGDGPPGADGKSYPVIRIATGKTELVPGKESDPSIGLVSISEVLKPYLGINR